MQRNLKLLAAFGLLCALAPAAPPIAAQTFGTLTGTVKGMDGKPYPDSTLVLKNQETGVEYSGKTDSTGHYSIEKVRTGHYDFTISDPQGSPLVQSKFDVHSGENPLDLNLKDLVNPDVLAARKKQEEDVKRSHSMKESFDAGRALIIQAEQLRATLSKTPADQRGPIQEQLTGLYQNALTDFQQSQTAAGEKDSNLHVIVFNIGEADEGLGKYDDALAAFKQAIQLAESSTGKTPVSKSQIAGYYSNLGNLLGKMGKIDDANKAYESAATADPQNAGLVWLNSGIVLYRANRLAEAVVPLQKATALLPNNAQAWYLLGASLVSTMDVKHEGDKDIPILKPGTVEAYQKAMELDPNGPWGQQAKEGLDQLQAMGAGIDTKIKVKKGKS